MNEVDLLLDVPTKSNPTLPRAPIFSFREEVQNFAGNLSQMLAGGVSLVRCLEILRKQKGNARFQLALDRVATYLEEGRGFSDSLAQEPCFPSFFVQMAAAGEMSGTLPEALRLYHDYLKRQKAIRQKVWEAASYPLFICGFGVVTVIVLLKFVIPKILSIYEGLEAPMPTLTQAVLYASEHLWMAGGILIATICGIYFLLRQQTQSSRFICAVPLIGKSFRAGVNQKFFSILSLLARSGIPLLESLKVAANMLPLRDLEEDATCLRESIAQGGGIAESFREISWLNDSAQALITAGEESGRLQEVFQQISSEASSELESRLQIGIRLIEPILILGVGLLVGVLVLAALLPVFEMTEWMR